MYARVRMCETKKGNEGPKANGRYVPRTLMAMADLGLKVHQLREHPSPCWTVEGDVALSDAALDAMARLLLSVNVEDAIEKLDECRPN